MTPFAGIILICYFLRLLVKNYIFIFFLHQFDTFILSNDKGEFKMKCNNCGNHIDRKYGYCYYCGTIFNQTPVPCDNRKNKPTKSSHKSNHSKHIETEPQPGIINSYIKFWKNYANFSDRTCLADYWWVILFNIIFSIGIGCISLIPFIGFITIPASIIYLLAALIPNIALAVRRLHDTNRSGAWYCINFAPFVGWIIFLIFVLTDGDHGTNQFGPDPRRNFQ